MSSVRGGHARRRRQRKRGGIKPAKTTCGGGISVAACRREQQKLASTLRAGLSATQTRRGKIASKSGSRKSNL